MVVGVQTCQNYFLYFLSIFGNKVDEKMEILKGIIYIFIYYIHFHVFAILYTVPHFGPLREL